MALVLYDRVQQTGTANTTVSFTLSATPAGYQSFAVVGNANTTYYSSFDSSGNWEVGIGTYATGGTLTRTTILSSSNTGSAVTFSGTVTVFISYPASKSVNLDAASNVSPLGTVASGTWNATTVAPAYGGTGQTSYTDGQLLIGNSTGNTLAKSTLTAGTGVTITNGSGSITVAAPLAKQTDVFALNSVGGTYTAPANTQWVKITVVGGGGSGGGTTNQRGTGGGGGGVCYKWLAMTAGQTLDYFCGGIGTTSTVSSGTLTITTISAGGGGAGTSTAYASSNTTGPSGGAASGGDINIAGGTGGPSWGSSTAAATQVGGKGGDATGWGSGGAPAGGGTASGVAGTGYGAGGGGGIGVSNTNGKTGIVIFEAY
jgi:hypothetical protein